MTPWTAALQAPLSMVFSRQEYSSGLPFPDSGIEPASLESPALAGRFFTTESPGKPLTIFQSLLKLTSIDSVMGSNYLILCHLLLLLSSIFPSIRVFSNESALCIRWPKYWIFSLSISPSNEYSVLVSFRIG